MGGILGIWRYLRDPFRHVLRAESWKYWDYHGSWNRTDVWGGTLTTLAEDDGSLFYSDDHNTYFISATGIGKEIPEGLVDFCDAVFPAPNNDLYVADYGSGLFRFKRSGDVVWQLDPQADERLGDCRYAQRADGGAYAINQSTLLTYSDTGRLKSLVSLAPQPTPLADVIELGDRLITVAWGMDKWRLRGLELNGTTAWQIELGQRIELTAQPLLRRLSEHSVLALLPRVGLVALDSAGTQLWTAPSIGSLYDTVINSRGEVISWLGDELVFFDSTGVQFRKPLQIGYDSDAYEPKARRLFLGLDDKLYLQYTGDRFQSTGGWVIELWPDGRPLLRYRLVSREVLVGAGTSSRIYTRLLGKAPKGQPWYNVHCPLELDFLQLRMK